MVAFHQAGSMRSDRPGTPAARTESLAGHGALCQTKNGGRFFKAGLFFLSRTPVVSLTVLAVVLRRAALELSISEQEGPISRITIPLGIAISFAIGLVLWLCI